MQTNTGNGAKARTAKLTRGVRLSALVVALLIGAVALRIRHDRQRVAGNHDDHAIAAELTAKVERLSPIERLPTLLKALQDPDPNVRAAALEPLAKLHAPEAVDAAEAAFRDSASIVRQAALETLPQIDQERGLRLQLAAFVDDDLWIRESVASQFSADPRHTTADARALSTLIRALDDSSPVVQTLAMRILRRMTGNDWHSSSIAQPEARQAVALRWKQWWATAPQRAAVPPEFDAVASRPSTRSDPAPDFQLNDTDGRTVGLASEQGKIVLLNFWGTWCPPCKAEIPDLIRLDAAYRSKGVEIVGVALAEADGVKSLRRYCAEHGIAFRQTLATDEILDAYGHIHEVPVTVLIDAHGRIRNRWEGERDFATFRAAIDRALKN
jgi:peroxiredoxin